MGSIAKTLTILFGLFLGLMALGATAMVIASAARADGVGVPLRATPQIVASPIIAQQQVQPLPAITVVAPPAQPDFGAAIALLVDYIKQQLMSPAFLVFVCSFLAMILPQGEPGTPWGLARQVIDLFALNMRNAANANKLPTTHTGDRDANY